jgi:hypothetical protein
MDVVLRKKPQKYRRLCASLSERNQLCMSNLVASVLHNQPLRDEAARLNTDDVTMCCLLKAIAHRRGQFIFLLRRRLPWLRFLWFCLSLQNPPSFRPLPPTCMSRHTPSTLPSDTVHYEILSEPLNKTRISAI